MSELEVKEILEEPAPSKLKETWYAIVRFLHYIIDATVLGWILWIAGIPFLSALLLSLFSVWVYTELYDWIYYKRNGEETE